VAKIRCRLFPGVLVLRQRQHRGDGLAVRRSAAGSQRAPCRGSGRR
jgi:hypothetical protein